MSTHIHGNIATAELPYPIATNKLCLKMKDAETSIYFTVTIMGSEMDCK